MVLLTVTDCLYGCVQEVASRERSRGLHTSSAFSEDSGIEVGIFYCTIAFFLFFIEVHHCSPVNSVSAVIIFGEEEVRYQNCCVLCHVPL